MAPKKKAKKKAPEIQEPPHDPTWERVRQQAGKAAPSSTKSSVHQQQQLATRTDYTSVPAGCTEWALG